jgi:hypothetical protein
MKQKSTRIAPLMGLMSAFALSAFGFQASVEAATLVFRLPAQVVVLPANTGSANPTEPASGAGGASSPDATDPNPAPLVFVLTGGDQITTVPEGYSTATFEVWAPGGGSGQFGGHGGAGSYAQGTFKVAAGSQYTLRVGAGGGVNGTSAAAYPYGGVGTAKQGGSGGGGSYVYQGAALLIAAGSGAGGGAYNDTLSGPTGRGFNGADGDSGAPALADGGCRGGGSATSKAAGTSPTFDSSAFIASANGRSGSSLGGGGGTSGGGGGYFGGGGGSLCLKVVGAVIPSWYMPAGSGSSFVAANALSARIVSGKNGVPGFTGGDYATGVGVGSTNQGDWSTMTAGGPGRIVVRYSK